MGKGNSKRKKIFDLYAKNLLDVLTLTGAHLKRDDSGEVVGFDEPAVLCPLCMVLFPEQYLYVSNIHQLTIEHVPPESVGGKGKILTCKRCNQKLGNTLDHHIQREMNIEPFLKGINNTGVKAKLRINNHIPLRTTITHKDGGIELALQKDKNIDKQYRIALDDLRENWNGSKLDFHFFGGNRKKACLALLKSAYLEMFAVFGHGFLCDNPNAAKIRKQINHPEEELTPFNAFIIDRDFPDNTVGVNVVIEPLDRLCFMVVLPLRVTQNRFKKKMGVFLPGPNEEAWDTYNNFLKDEKRNLRLVNLNDLNCIRNKSQALRFHEIWQQAKHSLL